MDEILNKANELGLMIKGSELYARFTDLSARVEADPQAKALMEEYLEFSARILEKEESGAAIEVDEKRRLEEMGDRVNESGLLKEYIATQTYFFNLLMQVQSVINDPKGEPIKESRIIKPEGPGKIITGL